MEYTILCPSWRLFSSTIGFGAHDCFKRYCLCVSTTSLEAFMGYTLSMPKLASVLIQNCLWSPWWFYRELLLQKIFAHLRRPFGSFHGEDSGVSAKGKLCGTRACLLLSKKLDLMRGCGSSLDSLVYILTYVCGPLLVMLPPINVSNLVSQLLHPLVSLPLSFFIITAHSAAALSLFS